MSDTEQGTLTHQMNAQQRPVDHGRQEAARRPAFSWVRFLARLHAAQALGRPRVLHDRHGARKEDADGRS
jgi:hypothetical protein